MFFLRHSVVCIIGYTGFRLVPKLATLNSLERNYNIILHLPDWMSRFLKLTTGFEEDKILIKKLYHLKTYNARQLRTEFPDKIHKIWRNLASPAVTASPFPSFSVWRYPPAAARVFAFNRKPILLNLIRDVSFLTANVAKSCRILEAKTRLRVEWQYI